MISSLHWPSYLPATDILAVHYAVSWIWPFLSVCSRLPTRWLISIVRRLWKLWVIISHMWISLISSLSDIWLYIVNCLSLNDSAFQASVVAFRGRFWLVDPTTLQCWCLGVIFYESLTWIRYPIMLVLYVSDPERDLRQCDMLLCGTLSLSCWTAYYVVREAMRIHIILNLHKIKLWFASHLSSVSIINITILWTYCSMVFQMTILVRFRVVFKNRRVQTWLEPVGLFLASI